MVAAAGGDDAADVEDEMSPLRGMCADLAAHVVSESKCGLAQGRYDGPCTFTLFNSNTYKGSLSLGKLHGSGEYAWNDAMQYAGSFDRNTIAGSGTYTWPDGGTYSGEICRGQRHGRGVYRKGALRYSGEWRMGKKHGVGVLRYSEEGHQYEGEFVAGLKHGWGRMQYPSGSVYEGRWTDDRRHGYGAMQWVVSRTTAAQQTKAAAPGDPPLSPAACDAWTVTGLPEPPPAPMQHSPRLERYEGDWCRGQPEGYGTYTWLCTAHSSRGDGSGTGTDQVSAAAAAAAAQGLNAGVGAVLSGLETPYQGDNVFKGWFVGGKREGKGILVLADGTVFEGTWAADVKEGCGVLMHTDGCVEVLHLRSNVIERKQTLVVGLTARRPGETRSADGGLGLTLNDIAQGDPVGLGLWELLDGTSEEERAAEFQRCKDLLLRSLPQLKLLYKFYSAVGPSASARAPSDAQREKQRRRRFEKLVATRVALSGVGVAEAMTPTEDMLRGQVSAEEVAFATTPAFLEANAAAANAAAAATAATSGVGVGVGAGNAEGNPPARRVSRREALFAQLHAACAAAAGGAEDAARAAAPQQQQQQNEHQPPPPAPSSDGADPAAATPAYTPLPAAPMPRRSLRPLPGVGEAERGAAQLKLHQLWTLLREAGVVGFSMPLHRVSRLVSGVVSRQPQEHDDLTCLEEEAAPAAAAEPDVLSEEHVDTLAPRPSVQRTVSGTKSVQRRPSGGTESKHSEAQLSYEARSVARSEAATTVPTVPTAADHRPYTAGLVSTVRRQQREHADDPQAGLLFSTMIQCLAKVAHVMVMYTAGHAYANASKSLTLCDRVNWLLTKHILPLADALTAAGNSPAGPALCIPRVIPQRQANLTHSGALPRGAKDAKPKQAKRPTSAPQGSMETNPAHAAGYGMKLSFTQRSQVTQASEARSRQEMESLGIESPMASQSSDSSGTYSSSSDYDTDANADKKTSDNVSAKTGPRHSVSKPPPSAKQAGKDRPGSGGREATVSASDKHQTCVADPSVVSTLTMTSVVAQPGQAPVALFVETFKSKDSPLPVYDAVCLGLATGAVHEADAALDAKHREAVETYTQLADVLEERRYQLRNPHDVRPAERVSAKQAHAARAALRSAEAPHRIVAAVPLRILLRTRPVVEALDAASPLLLRLHACYAEGGVFTVRGFVRVLRDGGVVGVHGLLDHSVTAVLRPCLWHVLCLDADAHCQVRTRGELSGLRQQAAAAAATAASAVPLVCPPPEEDGFDDKTLLSSKRGGGTGTGTLSFNATLDAAAKLDPALRAKLVARDAVTADPAWFDPVPTDSGVTDTWGPAVSSLPLLYGEFLSMLAVAAALAYTQARAPLKPAVHAINDAHDESLPQKVALLLEHLAGRQAVVEKLKDWDVRHRKDEAL